MKVLCFGQNGPYHPTYGYDADLVQIQRAAGEKSQGTGTPLLHKDGAIGSAFKADGAIGSLGQKVGGPFDKQGAIGKNFNADGKVGGTIQDAVKGKET